MLSLPEDWDYTTRGLAYICKDGVDSICATVRELEGAGYIVRARERHADGTLGGIEYTILEQPREPETPKRENPVQVENAGDAPKRAFPEQVKPVLGKPEQENPAQLNIQEQSKEILSTDSTKSFPSFPQERKTTQENELERRDGYQEQIMANVDYDYLVGYTEVDRARLDELVGLMLDTVCSTKSTMRGGRGAASGGSAFKAAEADRRASAVCAGSDQREHHRGAPCEAISADRAV